MTSQERNRCPQCNTGFFNAPNDESPESLLARCRYCDYQRDSIKCPNCDRGYLERVRPPDRGYRASMPADALRRFLRDPKHARCRVCGYQAGKTECPNCGRGVLEWKVEERNTHDGVGRIIGGLTYVDNSGETRVASYLAEFRGCSTCGYVDPSSIPTRFRVPGIGLPLGRLGCFIVLAIVLLVVFSFAYTCILGLTS